MKFPGEGQTWLGMALVVGVGGLTVGGIFAAIEGAGPSEGMITAITALLSAIVGGLVGFSAGKKD